MYNTSRYQIKQTEKSIDINLISTYESELAVTRGALFLFFITLRAIA